MSDENISRGEDKENLMYIFRQIIIERSQHYVEDHSERGSIISTDSTLPMRCLESDINLYDAIGDQIGPQSFDNPEMIAKTKPFDFAWSYGINSKTGVVNLTSEYRREIFIASSHLPILYNYCTKQMKCLEGHQYLISSISADQEGQFIATADDNKDGSIIIWDSYDVYIIFTISTIEHRNILVVVKLNLFSCSIPVYSMFSIYPLSEPILVKLSLSGRFLITVGVRKEGSYSVDLWVWSRGSDKPHDSYEVDKNYGAPVEICFNPNVEEIMMIIFKKQVVLLVWVTIQYFKNDINFNVFCYKDEDIQLFVKSKIPRITNLSRVGTLTTGCYVSDCHACYACSNKGCILVFSNTLYNKPFEEGVLDNLKIYINAIKVSQHAIRTCAAAAEAVVVGDASGSILFFDKTIKILYWFQTFALGPIVSISFNSMPKFKQEDLLSIYIVKPNGSNISECDFVDLTGELQRIFRTNLPKDASLASQPFLLPDFFIATSDNNIYAIDFLNRTCVPIFLTADDCVSAMEVHDELSISDKLQSNNAHFFLFILDHIYKSSDYKSAIHLICGRENGEIWILEPIVLEPKIKTPFRPSKNKVVKIVFSKNKAQFAYYDNNNTVALFVYNSRLCDWKFTGKIRSHYKDINDIIFMPRHHTSILYTIGCDRHLVEYNNNEARDEGLAIACRERIEQKAIPMSFLYWYEIVKDKKIGYLLIADNEHKFKLLDPETKIPKSVILAPAFGCFNKRNISKIMIIPNTEAKYMVFLADKFLGLHMLLPDGNPYKYVGYLGHPSKVVDFLLSYDGKYMFSFGTEDHCVFKWKIKTKAVELMYLLGGKELEPFYCLIEGGKNGWLFQEIKDLFYYMQILQHESMDYPRKVSDSINVSELPELVRTCGFYPTEFELENMMIDIKYRNYHETSLLNTEINFIDFVKLFCNHKPVYGYTKETIKKAFQTVVLNSDSPSENEISREEFASILAYSGEFISPGNLLKFLKTLMRSDNNDGNLEFLPENITFEYLYKEIFGIDTIRTKRMDNESNKEANEGGAGLD
ncbi:cilia- and flagella-associated protein 251-like [Anoplophora glabripennis]|uniref:cilia- and flagella-associated protein 251-like n=1 Tax=Anoplophora glabripennis TaxID=217634 RepID=UPI000C7662F6|nr:cilia- and flagella-associated protein 251-like [Anoplophora glabripennis]